MITSKNECFDENTLFKVYDALRKAGLDEDQSRQCIREMQNDGILFREHPKASDAPVTVYRGGTVASVVDGGT